MKCLVLALVLAPLLAQATTDDYAREWPIELSRADASAYRVELTPEVHAALHAPDMRDLAVLDADEQPVAWMRAATPTTQLIEPPAHALAWYVVPGQAHRSGETVRIEASGGSADAARGTIVLAARDVPAQAALLIDRGPEAQPLDALSIDWVDKAASVDVTLRIDASDDLVHWQPVNPDARFLTLHQEGRTLEQKRVRAVTTLRYLRLIARAGAALPEPAAIHGHAPPDRPAPSWRWLELEGAPHGDGFEYGVSGRYPIEAIDLELPPNSVTRWKLMSRATPQAEPAPNWTMRAWSFSAWTLEDQGVRRHSPPLVLADATTDAAWRIVPQDGNLRAAPRLRLGYQPAAIVFLAQGTPPYRLLAGRAAPPTTPATGADLAAPGMPGITPASASLGAPSERAGTDAYRAPARPIDWKTWILWIVLVVGALVVVGLALRVLRINRAGD